MRYPHLSFFFHIHQRIHGWHINQSTWNIKFCLSFTFSLSSLSSMISAIAMILNIKLLIRTQGRERTWVKSAKMGDATAFKSEKSPQLCRWVVTKGELGWKDPRARHQLTRQPHLPSIERGARTEHSTAGRPGLQKSCWDQESILRSSNVNQT